MADTFPQTSSPHRFRRLAHVLCAWLILAVPRTGWAEVMILLHGHLGSSIDWRISGFTGVLQDAGWRDGGVIDTVQNTADFKPLPSADPADTFYALDLPSEAALTVQAARLDAALQRILPRHPLEAL